MFAYLLISSLLIVFIFHKLIQPLFYWHNRGIFHVSPFPRFCKVFLSSKPIADVIRSAYNDHPTRRYYGSFQFLYPSLFVRDLDLIKSITVKDFDHFTDHFGLSSDKTDPILSSNLFSLKGQKWREMRSTLSPAFTTSKMKAMFVLISDTAELFAKHFEKNEDEVVEVEMKNLSEKFANDVIANCAFGIEINSLEDGENEFYKMGRMVSTPSSWQFVKTILFGLFPKLFELFGISPFPPEISAFFLNIIKEAIKIREEKRIARPDMIHLLLEARRGMLGLNTAEKSDLNEPGFATVQEFEAPKPQKHLELTDEVITGQALVFFLAGFTTSSTILAFLSYELAINPEIQRQLQQEVDEAIEKSKNNGRVSYEALLKMKFLDQAVSEALRKWPPGFALNRACVKDYKILPKQSNESAVLIEKGCLVTIPVIALHFDPEFFPEPEKFDPGRFSEENKHNIKAGSYLPFGSGPRNCIGSRFALLEIKALIVSLLNKFDFVPVEKTEVPIKLAKRLTMEAQNGVWIGLKKRSNKF